MGFTPATVHFIIQCWLFDSFCLAASSNMEIRVTKALPTTKICLTCRNEAIRRIRDWIPYPATTFSSPHDTQTSCAETSIRNGNSPDLPITQHVKMKLFAEAEQEFGFLQLFPHGTNFVHSPDCPIREARCVSVESASRPLHPLAMRQTVKCQQGTDRVHENAPYAYC